MTTLLQLEPFVTEGTAHMVAKFEEFAQTRVKVNFQHFAQCWAFDVIGLITVGVFLQKASIQLQLTPLDSASKTIWISR